MKEKIKEKKIIKDKIKSENGKVQIKKAIKYVTAFSLLFISISQSLYMEINDSAKKGISEKDIKHTEYVLRDRFEINYYAEHVKDHSYTEKQYKQDLNDYQDYNNFLKKVYIEKIKTDSELLSKIPDLKNQNYFISIMHEGKFASLNALKSFYEYKNIKDKKYKDMYKKLIIYYMYESIPENIGYENLNDEQKEMIGYRAQKNIHALLKMKSFYREEGLREYYDQQVISVFNMQMMTEDIGSKADFFFKMPSMQRDAKYLSGIEQIQYDYINSDGYSNLPPKERKEKMVASFENDRSYGYKLLDKNDQKKYLNWLINFSEKNKNTNIKGDDMDVLFKKDPEKFKNTLMLFRYATDVENIRNEAITPKQNNFKNLNFKTFEFLNGINKKITLQLNNVEKFEDCYSTVNCDIFSMSKPDSENKDNAVRLILSGFFDDAYKYQDENNVNYRDMSYYNLYSLTK